MHKQIKLGLCEVVIEIQMECRQEMIFIHAQFVKFFAVIRNSILRQGFCHI